VGQGKPWLRSEAEENREGAEIPCHTGLKKTRDDSIGVTRDGHPVIKYIPSIL